jgi:hypothetical protein
MELALRFGFGLSFLGRIVSLLAFRRKLPSARPDADRSWLAIVACAMDGTVSVSTVMFLEDISVRDFTVAMDDIDDIEARGERVAAR